MRNDVKNGRWALAVIGPALVFGVAAGCGHGSARPPEVVQRIVADPEYMNTVMPPGSPHVVMVPVPEQKDQSLSSEPVALSTGERSERELFGASTDAVSLVLGPPGRAASDSVVLALAKVVGACDSMGVMDALEVVLHYRYSDDFWRGVRANNSDPKWVQSSSGWFLDMEHAPYVPVHPESLCVRLRRLQIMQLSR